MNSFPLFVKNSLIALGTEEQQDILLTIANHKDGILYKTLLKKLPKEYNLARVYLLLMRYGMIYQEYVSNNNFGLNNLKLSASKIGKFFIEELFTINKKLCERIK